jgi:beta-glucosidase
MPDLEALLGQLDLEQKVRLLTGQDWWSLPAEPAIGLRSLVVSDGPAGVRGSTWSELSPSASFPSPTALAASWDVAAVAEVAGLLAGEARRKGVDVVLAPTVNLHRSPLDGRHFEAFSEDPLLSGRIGVAYVRGLQDAGVGATAKHYVANESETERFTVDIQVDERTLRELYLLPFELMVTEGGAWLVMAAYNSVNGTTMSENPLLTHPLKDEWGFDGVVVSDWYATRTTEAAGSAALDLAMPGPSSPWGASLVAAVRDDKVPESAVDDKVLRILRLAARVGALDGVEPVVAPVVPASPERLSIGLRDAAAAGMVLLRNKNLLPLAADPGRVAVIGQLAAEARIQGGGSASVVPDPDHVVSPLDGLRAALGDSVDHEIGVRLREGLPQMPIELVTDADGEHGLDVHWLAADGSVLGHERRRGARHFWLGDAMPNATEVRVSCRFRADAAGEWRFGVVGNGTFELDLAGETVIATTLAPAGGIVQDALRAKPEASVTRLLAAGDEFDIVLRHAVEPGAVVFEHILGAERPHRTPEAEFAAAVNLARDADLAIVVVGTTERVESEGFDRASLALPDGQDDLVRAVLAVNPRTVVVVNSGGPVLLPWRDDVGALLLTWFGGQELGSALAAVLLGELEPGGRLPTTWPAAVTDVPVLSTTPTDGALAYTEGVHVGYRAWLRADATPAFPFGHGLGYTTWDYLQLTTVDGPGEFTVLVRNSGPRAGKEVVQLYASRESSAVDRPVRWLIGFAVVTAAAGAEATATVTVAPRAWQHWSEQDGGWRTEPGGFTVFAGRSVEDLPLHMEVQNR